MTEMRTAPGGKHRGERASPAVLVPSGRHQGRGVSHAEDGASQGVDDAVVGNSAQHQGDHEEEAEGGKAGKEGGLAGPGEELFRDVSRLPGILAGLVGGADRGGDRRPGVGRPCQPAFQEFHLSAQGLQLPGEFFNPDLESVSVCHALPSF